ncbi:hypothetical protein FJT64_004843 [Amphibalanus amphitrite]|uniref:Uncharacterized protein n=1 Tax=Amphibalanus amphitrite TaxID=1232801 RepID=A0A6A4VSH7_AMPAM|nr:hypothetical protein FJT64_004843 [Amphibalanus amphitrite]
MCGSNNNPTPVEMKIRIRLLMMGASPAVAAGTRHKPSATGASVTMEEDSPSYLSASALGIDEEVTADDPDSDVSEICSLLDEAARAADRTAARSSSVAGPSASARPGDAVPADVRGRQLRYGREALVYVAGYLAHKCKDLDASLGKVIPPGSGGAELGFNRPELAWTLRVSRGGLTLPSECWQQQVEQFEVLFSLMHGDLDIDREPGVVRRLWEMLQDKYPHLDKRVLKKYAVTRTHMRIRDLERDRKARLKNKEPARSVAQVRYHRQSTK